MNEQRLTFITDRFNHAKKNEFAAVGVDEPTYVNVRRRMDELLKHTEKPSQFLETLLREGMTDNELRVIVLMAIQQVIAERNQRMTMRMLKDFFKNLNLGEEESK